jgi:type II secretory pathway pseudopilin PulG
MGRFDPALVGRVIALAIISAAIGFALFSIIKASEKNSGKQAAQIQEMMERAAIQCYALEGAYPPDIRYFTRYGVNIDEERYYYRYEQNMMGNYMPEIFVIPRY